VPARPTVRPSVVRKFLARRCRAVSRRPPRRDMACSICGRGFVSQHSPRCNQSPKRYIAIGRRTARRGLPARFSWRCLSSRTDQHTAITITLRASSTTETAVADQRRCHRPYKRRPNPFRLVGNARPR